MNKRLNRVGVLTALAIPALRYLSPDALRSGVSVGDQALRWLVLSSFFLIIWFLNGQLYTVFSRTKRLPPFVQFLLIILVDGLVVLIEMELMVLGWIPRSFSGDGPWHIVLYSRLGFGAAVLASIQFMLVGLFRQETLRQQNEQLRSERLMAELEGLKQQVNPHFLFNSLGTLRAMIREKDSNAEQYVLSLAAVYRQFLSKRTELTATLSDELDLMENYLFMLRFRFEESLNVTIDVDGQSKQAKLPVFCIQQLVSNCIKHNIVSVSKPLSIRVYQQNPTSITIENNKQLRLSGVDSTGTGLANLRKRCNLLGLTDGVVVLDTPVLFSVTVTLLDP